MDLQQSPFAHGTFTRPAHPVRGDIALTNSWAAVADFNAYGAQAHFDIQTENHASRGLRVTIARSFKKNLESNGYSVSVTVGNSLAVSITATNTAVTIVLAAATTMAQLKTAVDNNAHLSSAYYGGETGTGPTDAQEVADSAGAYQDRWSAVRIRKQVDTWIQTGTAAPTDNTGAIFGRNTIPTDIMMPPGHQLYLRTRSGTSLASAEMWRPADRA